MTLLALAMTRKAVAALLATPALAEAWLRHQRLPQAVDGLTVRHLGDVAYLLHEGAGASDRLAVIRVLGGRPLGEIPEERRGDAFARILKAVMSSWDPLLVVPHSWKPFHRGSLLSFQTNARGTEIISRAYLDNNPRQTAGCYLFLVSDLSNGDLSALEPEYDAFDLACRRLGDALDAAPLPPTGEQDDEGETSFELDGSVTFDVVRGRSFQDWSERHLTRAQLRFVAAPLNRSMRLRGPAGTGKTLALIIKFLKHCYDAIDQGRPLKAAFLAHSFATVELIRNYILGVDERGLLISPPPGLEILITTLHDLSNTHLRYSLEDVTPISLDGQEGRELQFELLLGTVDRFRKSEWVRYRAGCSSSFARRLELPSNSAEHRGFVYDLMNEFACVIDAFGSKSLEERRARYLKERRLAWMMPLQPADKEVVLHLYAEFRKQLRQMETISTDQMTADFLGYLDSFRWDAKRGQNGFDFIFVDELHLFNRQERLTLHLLTNDPETQPVVVMAYDPRQSPRDTFMDVGQDDHEAAAVTGANWKDTKLGPLESFEFEEVFRYTPQILDFLKCLDQAFPAEDFGAEWAGGVGQSVIEPGPEPKIVELDSTESLYKKVFAEAKRLANQRGATGRSVGVLCVSYDTFGTYLAAGQFKRDYVPITSRDELGAITHAGKRFVFSMPEYVAGLQFETVFLIDANAGELEALGGGVGAKRRFVSTLYLGASRSERNLSIYANRERGGIAGVLAPAIASQKLRWGN